MNWSRYLRKVIADFRLARTRQRLLRACPELRFFDEAEEKARQNHAPTAYIQEARKATINQLLKQGMKR